jgi:hypothetical protein
MTAPMQLCAPIGKYREPGGRQYSEFRRRVAEGKAVKRSATSRGELGSPAYSEMFVIEPKYES